MRGPKLSDEPRSQQEKVKQLTDKLWKDHSIADPAEENKTGTAEIIIQSVLQHNIESGVTESMMN